MNGNSALEMNWKAFNFTPIDPSYFFKLFLLYFCFGSVKQKNPLDHFPTNTMKLLLCCLNFIILFVLAETSFSQQPNIGTVSTSKVENKDAVPNGLYTSLSAMVYEQPLLKFKITYKKAPDPTDRWVTVSQIKIRPKLKNGEQLIYGFSDGIDFYINSRLYDPAGMLFRFSKLSYKGKKYSIFMAVIGFALPHQKYLAALDMENGKIYPITKATVRELISSDKQLSVEFANNAKTKQDFISYLIRYDRKY